MNPQNRIILINGQQLAALCIKYKMLVFRLKAEHQGKRNWHTFFEELLVKKAQDAKHRPCLNHWTSEGQDRVYAYRRAGAAPAACRPCTNKIGAAIESVLLLLKYRRPICSIRPKRRPIKISTAYGKICQEVWPPLGGACGPCSWMKTWRLAIAEPYRSFLANQCAEDVSYHLLVIIKRWRPSWTLGGQKRLQDPNWDLLRLLVAANFKYYGRSAPGANDYFYGFCCTI